MGFKVSGTTIVDQDRQLVNVGGINASAGILTVTNTLKVGTGITANAGIITANIIHLKGGTFGPIDGGSDTRADTAMVVGENFHIYNVESSGGHLRNLIEKSSNVISIGEEDTATINKIRLIPGSSNGVTELWAGDPSQSYNSIGILTANAAGVTVSGISSVGTAITMYGSTGIVSATSFFGSGTNLTGLTGASAATYGSASTVPQIVVNSDGKITGISNVSISGGGGGGGSGPDPVIMGMIF